MRKANIAKLKTARLIIKRYKANGFKQRVSEIYSRFTSFARTAMHNIVGFLHTLIYSSLIQQHPMEGNKLHGCKLDPFKAQLLD